MFVFRAQPACRVGRDHLQRNAAPVGRTAQAGLQVVVTPGQGEQDEGGRRRAKFRCPVTAPARAAWVAARRIGTGRKCAAPRVGTPGSAARLPGRQLQRARPDDRGLGYPPVTPDGYDDAAVILLRDIDAPRGWRGEQRHEQCRQLGQAPRRDQPERSRRECACVRLLGDQNPLRLLGSERVQAGTDERAKPGIIGTFLVVSLDEQAHPDAAGAGDDASAEGREHQCADHRGKLSAEQRRGPMTGPSLDEEPGNKDRRDYT